ncbi:MAG: anhydro-N-acetylmuramic acid kinase [Calditrichaeota bacterium]|nr:anhydro-N-acetylmuramic acid kinase [Calditrichota bacterium]
MSLYRRFEKNTKEIIGLMSGTSLDGLDMAHVQVSGQGLQTQFSLKAFQTMSYSPRIRELILHCAAPEKGSTACVSQLNFFLAALWGEYVLDFLKTNAIPPHTIDLIGSHGQTIYHQPGPVDVAGQKVRSTLQIGDPSVLAKRTGIPVVGNFRVADMALGGEGAPLVPYVDFLLLRSSSKNRAILNIGGIANVTLLPKNAKKEDVFAFDTGPGNMLIDAVAKTYFRQDFDRNAELARRGRVSRDVLQALLKDPFIQRTPPKSTGRRYFGAEFLKKIKDVAEKHHLTPYDLLATVTQFTSESIVFSYRQWIRPRAEVDEWIVSGGGARNPMILEELRKQLQPANVILSDDVGLPGDAKEAIAFAILANELVSGQPGNLPSVTGASRETPLGVLCFP